MAKALMDESKSNPLINADEVTINYLEALRMNPERFYLPPSKEAIDFQKSQGIPKQNQSITE